MKHTSPDLPDFADLKEAIEKLNTILKVANEGTRQADMTQIMNEIQASFNDVFFFIFRLLQSQKSVFSWYDHFLEIEFASWIARLASR